MSSILNTSGISSLAERAPDDGSPEFYLDCDPSRAPKLFTSCPVLPTEAAGKMKMAVLTNIRHERFAQGLAGGLNATEAYNSAGYSSKGAAQNAARLKARPSISTRVQECALSRTLPRDSASAATTGTNPA